ncbi:ferredoxin [Fervidicella metallireducens AeB]|uniref:Ferredoxin n=1 Tax=Fervidicella metallireducens AeB TaxID=1403537 RepID=A0A017RSF7_9CLOT|nr:DUF2703 domain-containing protein [Fervidicella metallireducens]EYE87521.1 ferredoxin [Fervidicella metallireducens AeB]
MKSKQTGCCSCSSGCCNEVNINNEKGKIVIDFLYLDLTTCDRCQGTDKNLEEALKDVSNVLETTGVEVEVNKVNVINEELALKYRFKSSPTIRVNGRDIQLDIKESLCKCCGDLCGEDVDCRVWVYQGKEYDSPPKAMIIESILKEVYGTKDTFVEEDEYILPENLKKFYAGMKKQ